MNLQDKMSLQQDFEAAVSRVDALPGDQAAAHMTDLYGLYKQATEGDHDTKRDEVGDDTPDNPNGPKGLSQAQWDAWSKYKGLDQDDARRQYVAKVNELAGPVEEKANVITGNGHPATGSAVNGEGAPGTSTASPVAQAQQQAGESGFGGLRGDLKGGTPYGGEDALKNAQ
ncbi:acyl-CoA-binding protein [Hymenobacter rigui]|nr:acyl-CoA-binding protein [Hymenobacter rigui]